MAPPVCRPAHDPPAPWAETFDQSYAEESRPLTDGHILTYNENIDMPELFLTEFEIYVLSAVTRLGDDAYGMSILREIDERTGRQMAVGVVYAALARLEDKALVTMSVGPPTPVQGGRARRYVRLTKSGRDALAHSASMLARMIPASVLPGGRK